MGHLRLISRVTPARNRYTSLYKTIKLGFVTLPAKEMTEGDETKITEKRELAYTIKSSYATKTSNLRCGQAHINFERLGSLSLALSEPARGSTKGTLSALSSKAQL